MIAGHLGVALGARALQPKAPWPHGPVVWLYLYRWPAADFVLELPLIVGEGGGWRAAASNAFLSLFVMA